MTCFEELLEQADQAMYEQKRMKRRRATERSQNRQLVTAESNSIRRSHRIQFPSRSRQIKDVRRHV
jgi:hypothetical protein